ncbi:MAG TPA: hypothetical protein VNM40_03675 [Candidatus Paceibacterota bacterium]|nr:hypothetical protein [Candidatus Paceibacterota bacterium]
MWLGIVHFAARLAAVELQLATLVGALRLRTWLKLPPKGWKHAGIRGKIDRRRARVRILRLEARNLQMDHGAIKERLDANEESLTYAHALLDELDEMR